MHEASDIDLFDYFEEDCKLRDHIRLTQGLQQLLDRRVEVVDRYALRGELRTTILEEAPKLVTKEKCLYDRDMLDRIRHIESYNAAGHGTLFEFAGFSDVVDHLCQSEPYEVVREYDLSGLPLLKDAWNKSVR